MLKNIFAVMMIVVSASAAHAIDRIDTYNCRDRAQKTRLFVKYDSAVEVNLPVDVIIDGKQVDAAYEIEGSTETVQSLAGATQDGVPFTLQMKDSWLFKTVLNLNGEDITIKCMKTTNFRIW